MNKMDRIGVILVVLMVLGCTKDKHCHFDVVAEQNWQGVSKNEDLAVTSIMSFEDGLWEWTTMEGDQSETIPIEFTEKVLLDRHLFIVTLWGDYMLVGTEVRHDCDHVYLKDLNGNVHCLDVEL